jgi:hypothetical protein
VQRAWSGRRNLGTKVEVLRGPTPADRIINSPPDSLVNSDLVRVAQQGNLPKAAAARSLSS